MQNFMNYNVTLSSLPTYVNKTTNFYEDPVSYVGGVIFIKNDYFFLNGTINVKGKDAE